MNIRWWRCWKWAVNYFPIKVVKTVDLPANGHNYMAICHPHGAMALSPQLVFGTEGADISRVFPGLRSWGFGFWFFFITPFQREFFMAIGGRPATDSAIYRLLQSSTNNLAGLVVGGVRDFVEQRPDEFRLVVRRRRGFCRLALKTGTHLVPVISFGEDRIFHKVTALSSSIARMMDQYGHRFIGTALFYGRGFTRTMPGPLPRRYPITVVFGAPIKVNKISSPTKEDIQSLNDQYCSSLTKLYNEHKSKYGYTNLPIVLV